MTNTLAVTTVTAAFAQLLTRALTEMAATATRGAVCIPRGWPSCSGPGSLCATVTRRGRSAGTVWPWPAAACSCTDPSRRRVSVPGTASRDLPDAQEPVGSQWRAAATSAWLR